MPGGKISQVNTDDSACNYIVGDKDRLDKIAFGEMFLTPLDSVDYNIEKQEIANKKVQENKDILTGLTKPKSAEEIEEYCDNFQDMTEDKQKSLSYLNVSTIEEGTEWYKKEFPQIPEELCAIMARWNWGDLSQLTKKKVKNDIKKIAKGNKKTKEEYGLLEIKQGPFVVEFN